MKKCNMMTTIIIPKKLNEKLKLMANEREISRNSLIIELIKKYVKENEVKNNDR